jgi:hypothetical protein
LIKEAAKKWAPLKNKQADLAEATKLRREAVEQLKELDEV